MPQIPTYPDWMKETELKWKPRSSKLKDLDKAILAYSATPNEKIKVEIRKALADWIRSVNGEWETSPRNHPPYFAIKKLKEAVYDSNALTQEEMQALQYVEEARRHTIQTVFSHAQIRLRVVDTWIQFRAAYHDFQMAMKQAGGFGQALVSREVMAGVNDLFGTQVQDAAQLGAEIVTTLGAQSAYQIVDQITNFLPVVSLVKDAVLSLAQWGSAVKTLMNRDLEFQIAKATISTAATGARAGLLAAKGAGAVFDPVVGALKAALNCIRVLAKFAIEFRESRRAKKLLRHPDQLNLKAFNKCPLLGAYFLIGANTSDLTAMLVGEFGQTGWQDDFEKLIKKHIHPIQEVASEYVQKSQFIVKGVPLHRSTSGDVRSWKILTTTG